MELDREALMHIIDSRVRAGIEAWYQMYMLPLHNENKSEMRDFKSAVSTKLDEFSDAFSRAKGAYWAMGVAVAAAVIVINHYWK